MYNSIHNISTKNWYKEVPLLSDFYVSRYFFPVIPNFDIGKSSIAPVLWFKHEDLYTVTYFRIVSPSEDIPILFVSSKNQVRPEHKDLTLLRLELATALLSAKLSNILNAFQINIPCFYWTDLKIACFLAKGGGYPEKFKSFVKNCVQD